LLAGGSGAPRSKQLNPGSSHTHESLIPAQ